MPATEQVWRNLKTLHAVFAASSIAMLGATLWMMEADFDDEWRPLQNEGQKLRADQLAAKQQAIATHSFVAEQKELEQRLAETSQQVESHAAELREKQQVVDRLDGQLQLMMRDVRFARAKRDKLRADYDLKIRDGLTGEQLKPFQQAFDKQQSLVDELELGLVRLREEFDRAQAEVNRLTEQRDLAAAAVKKHEADLDRLAKARQAIEPETRLSKFKRGLMELPIVEGFNGPFKISQLWLPDLTINYGGMRDVARFDRCTTCHLNIDAVETGNLASFPFDPHGASPDNALKLVREREAARERGEVPEPLKYAHPFSTHPNPDLYLTASSPHPMQTFGCTICHEGQGSGTSFQNASHSPNSPHGGEVWHDKYKWFHNHFWEFPMYPKRLAESGCIKCHHSVVELGTNPKFGASAPKAYAGYDLIRQYGCFGCHEINGYNAGKPIGPDMRLEPQTADEAERIAADPNAYAGQFRKVGPGLRHFGSKTTKEWTSFWINDPRQFRPETRMPRFFHLLNQRDSIARKFQPVEIAGITAYLFAKSEPLKLDKWKEGYEPNKERGKQLFGDRGCLACHRHDDAEFATAKADFGPNLTNVHAKLKDGPSGKAWLYTWLRDPTRHSARTRMPNTYLEPSGEGDAYVDPAADIAAFLLDKGPGTYETQTFEPAVLDELVRLHLAKSLTPEQVDLALADRRYPKKASEVKGDEVELTDGPITDETKLLYVGRRTISRYGCYGCHDIPGFERARPIGTALQDWGRKDPSKLALEHIEEYLHHHGEPDGSSTSERIERANQLAEHNEFKSDAERESATSSAYFFEQLHSHGRAGFLWQKLREPRSYDYRKTSTKGFDERLRMPQFPLNEQQIEAISTFVLGLVAEPPAEKYLYRPQGPAKSRIEGEKLLVKYNCVGCHMVELPEVRYAADLAQLSGTQLQPGEYEDGLKLLLKLKPPRNGLTGEKTPAGEPIVSFHGIVYQSADPSEEPADQEYSYDLWETLKVDDKTILPGARMLVPAQKQLSVKPARGGAYAEWLVDSLMKRSPDNNRSLAWQMSPPPLYLEGMKVQTSWLYSFLRDPNKIRYTTVLRMPRFNMSGEEAQKLADYFSAADGSPYPYLEIPQREHEYVEQQAETTGQKQYLPESWKLLNAPLCIKCHSVGGREYQASDPKKDIRGPNLDAVPSRLRPDWTLLWLYKPQWITPYTSMPQPFPKNQQNFPEYFGGHGGQQTIAVRDALMNYHRLLEREGKLGPEVAASQRATAPPQGAGNNPPTDKAPAGDKPEPGGKPDPAPSPTDEKGEKPEGESLPKPVEDKPADSGQTSQIEPPAPAAQNPVERGP